MLTKCDPWLQLLLSDVTTRVKTLQPGFTYPNVNLNSISLYKGVFMEPLGDKFLLLIASLIWHRSVGHNGLVHRQQIFTFLNPASSSEFLELRTKECQLYRQVPAWIHNACKGKYDECLQSKCINSLCLVFSIWKEFEYFLASALSSQSWCYQWFNPWLVQSISFILVFVSFTPTLSSSGPVSSLQHWHYYVLTPGQSGNWRKFSAVMRDHLFNSWSEYQQWTTFSSVWIIVI